jgi:cell division protease FtsH
VEKITLGAARHILLNPVDRECTAYHESGHALLGLLVPGSDPVHRVAIVPRGMALGATYQLPTDDRTGYAEEYLRPRGRSRAVARDEVLPGYLTRLSRRAHALVTP